MAGDGGDVPPHTTLDDGKFLLELLQRRPHHIHRPQAPQQQQPPPRHDLFHAPSVPSPPQSLAHDPAVAAVGPSLTFPMQPSNGHDFAPRPWSHALSSPYLPHPVGFPQNPPWTSLPPGFPGTDGLGLHSPLDRRLTDEENLGFLGVKIRNNSADPQGAQKLMFGSFPCEIGSQGGLSNGGSVLGFDRDGLLSTLNASEEREMGVCNRGFDGSVRDRYLQSPPVQNLNAFGRSGSGYRQQQMPPGFSKKMNSDSRGRCRGIENSMDEVNHRGFSSNGKHETLRKTPEQGKMQTAEARLYEQLGQPAPPSGANIHSDVDESLMDGRSEDKRRMGGGSDQARRELDDLSERVVDSLGLDDGWDEIIDLKQHPNSRDKEVRSDPRGQLLLSQRERNFKRHMECRLDIRELNAPFLSIYESLIPLEDERAIQKKFMTLLEKLVYEEWPDAQLHLYGSNANSFELSKSDVDVCLVFKDEGMDKSEVLMRLADILRSANLQNVQALTRARVPVVKLMDPETGISCDICINNMLAVENTKLLRYYAQIDVRLRQLAFIVKHWAKSRGVNETYRGTLSSYAYVLMCIHFLQQRKPAILPCLQGMKPTYLKIVDDVQCAYFDQVDSLRKFGSVNEESIAQLVWAFFNYWAYCHNYTNDVISVRTGRMISKRTKDWTRRVGNDRHLICIEDPFDVSHDLGRVVDRKSITVLREEFERAAHIMQHDPNPCVSLFEPYMPR